MISEIIVEYIKTRLFSPKDYFERTKRNLVSRFALPLFFLIGTPSFLITFFSSITSFEARFGEYFIKFAGSTSSDILILSISIVAVYLFSLGLNLYYAKKIKDSSDRTEDLKDKIDKQDSFKKLRDHYDSLVLAGKNQEAMNLGIYISQQFPDLVKVDPEFVIKFIERGTSSQIQNQKNNAAVDRFLGNESQKNSNL